MGSGVRPPWWRTVLFVLLTGFLSLFSLVFSPLVWEGQRGDSGSTVLLMGAAMLLAVLLPVGLFWRHRWPFVVALASAGVALVFPIGNALPLLALATLHGRRRGPAVWWTTALVGLASVRVVWADVTAQPRAASFWKAWFGPQPAVMEVPMEPPWPEAVVVVVLGLGLAVGSGLLVRWRREAGSARQVAQAERATAGRLGDEVARRQERERIAREVHDAMGHRLSLLNLHAGALEANAPDDPRVAQSAQVVRESASAAMDDLRSLLDVLQQPDESDLPPVPLRELAGVVRESFGVGQLVNSSILVQDADRADPALTRAIYRIVQELLTNARKHAPGEAVFLTVEGSPADGVVIEARNRFPGGWRAAPPGASRGLVGITERAHLLGGTAAFGVDGDAFRVRVELPWASV